MKKNKSIISYIIGFFIVFLVLMSLKFLLTLYISPSSLMTAEALQLKDEELVNAQNDTRTHLVQLTGGILVLSTLCFTFWNTRIARDKMKLAKARFAAEKENLWVEKVREAYSEWAGLFIGATIIGTKLAKAVRENSSKKEELRNRYHELQNQAEIVTYRIFMLEKRVKAIEAFKKLNSERYPNDPLPDQKKMSDFYNVAERDEDIIGSFHGLIKDRLRAFSAWLSTDMEKAFEMPSKDNYLKYINTHEKFRNKEVSF